VGGWLGYGEGQQAAADARASEAERRLAELQATLAGLQTQRDDAVAGAFRGWR
jgi:hypothetical protein